MLFEFGCQIFGATKIQGGDLMETLIDVIESPYSLQQTQCGFFTDTRHAGNVVRLVAE